MIVNLYKNKMALQATGDVPKLTAKEMIKKISEESGIGQRTVSVTLSEYRNKKTVTSPNKTKIRPKVTDKIDEFNQNAIRQKVHKFWHNHQIPTLNKMLSAVNVVDSLPNFSKMFLYRVLKHLNFEYVRKSCNSALIERNDIVCWRRRYLETIKHYRQLGSQIYYLDETWVNAGETTSKSWVDTTIKSTRDAFLRGLITGQKGPSGKGKRLIVVHIGSSDGFVPGGLFCFESKKNTQDYHDEMNMKKDPCPVISWKKADIINWLENKGEVVDHTQLKSQLLERAQVLKPQYEQYVIDELAKANNKTVVRLPPYHCELNPIELAWSSVKNYVRMNNTTYKLQDVRKLV
ncbi:hypothetical protein QTP88_010933 [Uroleucon formosanum]